jgi:hypothetical protein
MASDAAKSGSRRRPSIVIRRGKKQHSKLGRSTVKTAAINGRRAVCLFVIALALATCGCMMSGGNRNQAWQFQRVVEEAARSTQRARSTGPRPATPQAKPNSAQPKTTDSTDSDERHPSRWKRKLKAAYA